MAIVFIGIGSNLGNRSENIDKAIQELKLIPQIEVAAVSSLRETVPYQAAGPNYLNGVAKIDTDLEPEELLTKLQEIEESLGRKRPFKNAPRTIDLDILFYGSRTVKTARLKIPHPRICERNFVIEPLLEIEPNFKQILRDVCNR